MKHLFNFKWFNEKDGVVCDGVKDPPVQCDGVDGFGCLYQVRQWRQETTDIGIAREVIQVIQDAC